MPLTEDVIEPLAIAKLTPVQGPTWYFSAAIRIGAKNRTTGEDVGTILVSGAKKEQAVLNALGDE